MHSLSLAALLASAVMAVPTALDLRSIADCHEKSLELNEWSIKDFDFHASYTFSTPAHQNSWGYTNFNLSNSALQDSTKCSSFSNQLNDFYYGDRIYKCDASDDGSETTYTFSRPQGLLTINQTWACTEANSKFWLEGKATLDLKCEESYYQNPNWTLGEIYSSRVITCDHQDSPINITKKAAIM